MEHVILLTKSCNQKCLFCFRIIETSAISYDDIKKEIDSCAEKGITSIVFSGGEPTVYKHLFKVIEYAKSLKYFDTISLQTNAIQFSNLDKILLLKQSSVDMVLIPFHSHIEKLSDYLTQSPGTWRKTLEGIKNLHNANIYVTLNVVINAITYKTLEAYIEFIKSELPFVNNLTMSVANPDGVARLNPWIVPRYSDITNILMKAHSICLDSGITSINPDCGIPICFLLGVEQVSSEYIRSRIQNLHDFESELVNEYSRAHKIKPPQCDSCFYNSSCEGVWRAYGDIYGYSEITPVLSDEMGNTFKPDLSQPSHLQSMEPSQIKISNVCNNKCSYCPDSNYMNGAFADYESITKEISKAYHNGARSLIFTGGEPPLHPKFHDLVSFAKNIGFKNIASKTNGRIFSYSSFSKKSRMAGLSNIRCSFFSIEPHIHDSFTRARDSFKQTVAGITSFTRISGPGSVSMDITINKYNQLEIPSIRQTFRNYGVREIFLRNIVPCETISKSVISPDDLKTNVSKYFSSDLQTESIGFPHYCYENIESVMPDHNAYRMLAQNNFHIFQSIIDSGKRPCALELCESCLFEDFCMNIQAYSSALKTKTFDGVSTTISSLNSNIFSSFLEKSSKDVVSCKISSDSELEVISQSSLHDKGLFIIYISDYSQITLKKLLRIQNLLSVYISSNVTCEAVEILNVCKLHIAANKSNLPWLFENINILEEKSSCLSLFVDRFSNAYEYLLHSVDIKSLLPHIPEHTLVDFATPCLKGNTSEYILFPLEILDQSGSISLINYLDYFLEYLNHGKSLRCKSCNVNNSCPGINASYLKTFGFKTLEPIS